MKIKKYKVITISVILLFLTIVLITVYMAFQVQDFKRLRSTTWIKKSDKYESNGEVEFPGIPIQIDTVIFYEDSANICMFKETEEDTDEESSYLDNEVCIDYDYEWKKGKLIINRALDEDDFIKYTYIFKEKDQLEITYSGEGFEYTMYFVGAKG